MDRTDWIGALLQGIGVGGQTYFDQKQRDKDRARQAALDAQAKAERDRAYEAQRDDRDFTRATALFSTATPETNFADNPEAMRVLEKSGMPLVKRLDRVPGQATAPMALPTGQTASLGAPPPPIGKQNDEFAEPSAPTPPPSAPFMSPVGGVTLGGVKDFAGRPKTAQEAAMASLQELLAKQGGNPAMRSQLEIAAQQAGINLPNPRADQRGDVVPDPKSDTGYSRVWRNPDTGAETRTPAAAPTTQGPSSGDVDFARRASAVLGRTVKPGEELAPVDLKRVYSTDFTPPQGAAPKPPSMSEAAKVPDVYRIATQRALGASRRPVAEQTEIHNTVARLWQAQDTEGLHSYLRQMAIEGEPAARGERIYSRIYTADSLKEAKTLIAELRKSGVDTGLLEGSAEKLQQWLGTTGDSRLASLGTQLAAVLMDYRRSITGAAFTESEAKAYNSIWPDISNDFSLNNSRIDGMLKVLQSADEHYWKRKLGDAGAVLVGAIPGASASAANKSVSDVPGFPGYEAVTQPDGSVKIVRKGGGGS